MRLVHDTIQNRIAHIHIGACHVDFGTKHRFTVAIFAKFHIVKALQILFNTGVTIR